jgi:hypothetical protein
VTPAAARQLVLLLLPCQASPWPEQQLLWPAAELPVAPAAGEAAAAAAAVLPVQLPGQALLALHLLAHQTSKHPACRQKVWQQRTLLHPAAGLQQQQQLLLLPPAAAVHQLAAGAAQQVSAAAAAPVLQVSAPGLAPAAAAAHERLLHLSVLPRLAALLLLLLQAAAVA